MLKRMLTAWEDWREYHSSDPWMMIQSGSFEAKVKTENKRINSWADSKANTPAALEYRHASVMSSDCYYVSPGTAAVNSSGLFTMGLVSCAALAFTDRTKNFLAHIRPDLDLQITVAQIVFNFDLVSLRSDPGFSIILWSGNQPFKESALDIAQSLLKLLNLEHKVINRTYIDAVDEYSDVGINCNGSFIDKRKPESWKSPDAIIVKQNTAIVSTQELLTDRLTGNCVLAFSAGNKCFLALVDAGTSYKQLCKVIADNFNLDELKSNPEFRINFFTGNTCAIKFPELTIKYSLKKLGLEHKLVDRSEEVIRYSEIGVNTEQGVFCQEVTNRRVVNTLRWF